jgi:hypothetical protein
MTTQGVVAAASRSNKVKNEKKRKLWQKSVKSINSIDCVVVRL